MCCDYRHHQFAPPHKLSLRSFSLLPLSAPSPSQPSLLADKGGITITDNGDFGVVEIGERRTVTMTIRYQPNQHIVLDTRNVLMQYLDLE